jgi:hypothetical protein
MITSFLRYFYAMEILYFFQIAAIKLVFLVFYLRIFPSPTILILLRITIAVVVLYGALFVGLGVFQCRPISYFWTRWDGQHEGTCLDNNAIGWANAVVSILLDVWMLAVPLSQISGLRLSWGRKLQAGLMFSVGALYVPL